MWCLHNAYHWSKQSTEFEACVGLDLPLVLTMHWTWSLCTTIGHHNAPIVKFVYHWSKRCTELKAWVGLPLVLTMHTTWSLCTIGPHNALNVKFVYHWSSQCTESELCVPLVLTLSGPHSVCRLWEITYTVITFETKSVSNKLTGHREAEDSCFRTTYRFLTNLQL